jgi:Short C-terminal domain
VAEQGKQKLAEQQAKRTELWANDPNTLWFGASKRTARHPPRERAALGGQGHGHSPGRLAAGQRHRRRRPHLRGSGLWREPGHVHPTGAPEHGTTSGQVVLDNIEHPHQVYDLLAPLVSEARHKKTVERQTQYLHVNPGPAAAFGAPPAPPAPPAPAAPPPPDLVDQLRRLGELRDAGILTEEEFAAQKAKLLGA